jgi:hypothetical protein
METPIPFEKQQPTYVSTGHLPSVEQVRELVAKFLSQQLGMDLFVSKPGA